jgi:hypothetical protein
MDVNRRRRLLGALLGLSAAYAGFLVVAREGSAWAAELARLRPVVGMYKLLPIHVRVPDTRRPAGSCTRHRKLPVYTPQSPSQPRKRSRAGHPQQFPILTRQSNLRCLPTPQLNLPYLPSPSHRWAHRPPALEMGGRADTMRDPGRTWHQRVAHHQRSAPLYTQAGVHRGVDSVLV